MRTPEIEPGCKFSTSDNAYNSGVFEHIDEIIDEGRYHQRNSLRQDYTKEVLARSEAERKSSFCLTALNGEKPSAEDFGLIGSVVNR